MSATDTPALEVLPALLPVPAGSQIIGPLVTVEEAKAGWEHYQRLTQAILDESDYQTIGKKKFKKKAAWRKYMRFYGLDEDEATVKIIVTRNGSKEFDTIARVPIGFPLFATAFVVIRAGNGKTWTGYHECHIGERCCAAARGDICEKKSWSGHTCCKADCPGVQHWSHAGDLPATAHTRAKNRAISDAIGAGEVSAEEMEGGKGGGGDQEEYELLHVCPGCGETGAIIKGMEQYGGGWVCWKKGKRSDGSAGCGWKGQDEPPREKDDAPGASENGGKATTQAPPQAQKAEPPPPSGKTEPAGEAKTLFYEMCKLCSFGKAELPDVYDFLRHYLGTDDLTAMDDFSKAEKVKQVILQEKQTPGAGAKWVKGIAEQHRKTKQSPPAASAPTPAAKPHAPAAAAGPNGEPDLMTRHLKLCRAAGDPDGLRLMNRYLDKEMGHHNVTTITAPEELGRFARVFAELEKLAPKDLRAFLLDEPPPPQAQPEQFITDDDIPF